MNAYDATDLCAHKFLLLVMRDPALDLHTRICAAGDLMQAGLGDISHVRTVAINIEAPPTPPPGSTTLGVISDAGAAPDHRPQRRFRNLRLVR
jgi:hypothetical protein